METNSEMYHPNQQTERGTPGSGEENDFGTQSYQGYSKPADISYGFGSPTKDWNLSKSSPSQEDGKLRLENNQLRIQVKQFQLDLQAEQETVSQLKRRLNAVEKERLESTSRSNTEITELEGTVARLRSQLEKGEAIRQNLEFELTKSRRDVNQHKQSSAEKMSNFSDIREDLERKNFELTEELTKMEDKVQSTRQSAEDKDRKQQRKIEEKNHEVSKLQTELEIMRAERDKLDSLVQQHENGIGDMSDKIQELEIERKNQTENLRRTLTEIEYAKEREDRLKKDLEAALHKLRSIEENIEAERASHLETKFNSEIVQLRVRDLEGALDVEKSANNEANKAIDRLSKQIRELEHSYDEERKNGKELGIKLERTEKEYKSVKKQLTNEVDNKKNVIGSLSKELEVHQKNFNELKDELNKAKKRQIYLEETYGGSMRELELLLHNFQVDDNPKKSRGKKESDKLPAPTTVLESLRHTLSEYKRRLETTSDELVRMRKLCESLGKEVDQCKEMIWAKDKSLEDAQKNYTRTAKELNRVRSEYGELESTLTKMKIDLHSTASNQTKDRKRVHELSEEIMKLVKRQKNNDEEKLAFLHGMYQRLLAGRVMVSAKDHGLNQFSWGDLASLVYDQVSALVSTHQRAEEKVHHLEEALRAKEGAVEEIQKSYEDQLNKLTSLTKERELSWQKQKEEIEGHYQQLLNELQNRSKKSQAMADQAWEKIRMTGSVKQGLEGEVVDLRQQLTESRKHNTALLAAVSLLSGAFFPLCSRNSQLSLQRKILEDQLTNWEFCRDRIELLVATLGEEMKVVKEGSITEKSKPVNSRRQPLLLFRVGVVTVIAANRLRCLRNSCSRMFVTYDTGVSPQNGLVVCTGGVKPPAISISGAREDFDHEQQSPEVMLQWFSNPELLNTILTSTSDFLEVIDHVKDKDKASQTESRAVVNAAKNCFTKLIDKISKYFEGVPGQPQMAFRERNSLVRQMGRALTRTCNSQTLEQKQHLVSLQELLGALQNHILDFTQRLHTVEVERRNLMSEMDKLREESEMGPDRGEVEQLQDELNTLKDKELQNVSMDKFESVCHELNNALRREQQAQQLLIEQGRQLEEVTMRLDLYTTEGMEKEQTLTEAVHGLAETKMEVKRKEQTLRQLNRQVITYEGDKKTLMQNIHDAEKALRTVAKDKEILIVYVKNVENALEQARKELLLAKPVSGREISLSKLLLNADFIPGDVGKAGQELIACQNLVGAFVDHQNQAYAKVKALEDEIESHRRHILTLKRELSDAVRREYEEESQIPTRDCHKGHSEEDFFDSTSAEFLPIKEDSDISFVAAKVATPKTGSKKTDKSPKYMTPTRSSRSHVRPKAFEPHGR
ncbi:coiled-coil domain-containing protein 171-like isoform X2 [Mytilus trossulus]|uniref:coiled-coil domain-containing protein 171-like isoform X2 n=1 Tax=Mytilus trossulus TaxID=6551 RepID=UPI0030071CFA